jgi:hypothetical protein
MIIIAPIGTVIEHALDTSDVLSEHSSSDDTIILVDTFPTLNSLESNRDNIHEECLASVANNALSTFEDNLLSVGEENISANSSSTPNNLVGSKSGSLVKSKGKKSLQYTPKTHRSNHDGPGTSSGVRAVQPLSRSSSICSSATRSELDNECSMPSKHSLVILLYTFHVSNVLRSINNFINTIIKI